MIRSGRTNGASTALAPASRATDVALNFALTFALAGLKQEPYFSLALDKRQAYDGYSVLNKAGMKPGQA